MALSHRESIDFITHLSELVRADLPLASGLRALAKEMPPGRLATSLDRLSGHLEHGVPLDTAVEKSDVRLPIYLRGLLACGLRSGNLGLVLEQFLAHERLDHDLRRRLWSALAYPLLLLVMLTIWVLFVLEFLVGTMRELYDDFEVSLPSVTKSLLWAADYGPQIILGIAIAIAVFLIAIRWWCGWRIVSDLLSQVPMIGPMWRDRGLGNFSNLLGLLLEQSVPLPTALTLTATGLNDGSLAAACRRSACLVEQGSTLSECVARVWPFPPSLVPIVAWGDQTSSQPAALRSAAEMFRSRAGLRSQFLWMVLPALVFILVTGSMLYVVVALFAPLVHFVVSLT